MTILLQHLLLVLLAIGCLGVKAQGDATVAALDAMSLQRKVAQLFMVSFYSMQLSESEAAFLREFAPGAAVIFKRNVVDAAQVKALTDSWQREATASGGLPALIAVDQEGGPIQTLRDGFTTFPTPLLWTATANTDLIQEVGAAMASELSAVGVHMNLAPVADLLTNRDNPIIKRRSFGGAPDMVTPAVAAYIRGLQSGGVIATAKHFPGHGETTVDSHLDLPRIDFDRARLDAVELAPFRAAIDSGVDAVMVGHLWLSAFDADPLPASLSANIVTGLLRGELGFDGLIMTDALDMDAVDTRYSLGEASVMALEAGADLIVAGAHVGTDSIRRAMKAVLAAVESGRLTVERIDESVARMLNLKAEYGILAWQPSEFVAAQAEDIPTHEALARRLFEAGITAVDNADSLPLSGRTLFLYPGTNPRIQRECERDGQPQDFFALSLSPTAAEIGEALRRAEKAENVVLFTLDDGANLALARLAEALPPQKTIVAALMEPPKADALERIGAAVMSYSPISPATSLVCEVLHGEREAKGIYPFQ